MNGTDRTRLAVQRWMAALPSATYDLRILPPRPARPICRLLDAQQLLASLGWIRARNAAGAHVYCRPVGINHVLVDDLDPDGVAALGDRHHIAATVETSPSNFQCWVTVAAGPIATPLASAAARLLAQRFGGDPGAASAVQLGRLVGTTNRKARHERADGSYPFVLLRHARAGVDPGGPALLAEAEVPLRAAEVPPCPVLAVNDAARAEAAAGAAWLAHSLPKGAVLDRSRADLAIARRVLRRGGDADFARQVVVAGAKAQAMSDTAAQTYARRTIAAALRDREG